jgi:hypothetical protein
VIRLVVRADDAGSCASANEAVAEVCRAGVARNVSVMACGPAFDEMLGVLAPLSGVCVGLHVTLNAEWDTVKWGPVLSPDAVPSLVDERGHFLPTPDELLRRGFDPVEVMGEVAAQLARARDAGLPVAYLDEHMMVGRLPGLRDRFAAFARSEGLAYAPGLPALPDPPSVGDDLVARWTEQVARAAEGTYLLVTHPGRDADDMRRFVHAGLAPGQVARERDAERCALCAPRLPDALRRNNVELIRYTEVHQP